KFRRINKVSRLIGISWFSLSLTFGFANQLVKRLRNFVHEIVFTKVHFTQLTVCFHFSQRLHQTKERSSNFVRDKNAPNQKTERRGDRGNHQRLHNMHMLNRQEFEE